MSVKRIGLLCVVAFVFFLVPTGCEQDRPLRVEDIEGKASPVQLGEWLEQFPAIIRSTHMTGPETSRMLAYASIAYYEGYAMGYDDMRSLVGQLQGLDELPVPDPNLGYSYGIISESAMRTVLLNQFQNAPANIKNVINSTYTNHEREYAAAGFGEVVVNRSRAFGELLGDALNVWADSDGYLDVLNCTAIVPSGQENWQPTPPSFQEPEFACWGNIRAFTFNPNQLIALCHTGSPVAVSNLSGSAYRTDIEEVVSIEANLTQEQKDIADFWRDDDGAFTVPGHYVSILGQLVGQNLLDGKQAITAWAQLSIAMADTYISTYKLKYTYYRPRPLTFVQNNSNVNWESYLTNPNTPEYPSMRSTLAYAAAQVFINLYGNNLAFTDKTHVIFNLQERSYASFTEMAEEVVASRLYAGTNLRTTLENSEYHGRCIAQRANELFFNE
ncbi:MAG: phosphatase PAP2 family protein [Flavobacteriales bacterium]|nr:phosphatase PAP2 family protein [Flavobacteriales bacterium]